MFNGDVVKNAQLYKGDFPANFGGLCKAPKKVCVQASLTQTFSDALR